MGASRGSSSRRLSKPARHLCCDASRDCHRSRQFPAVVPAQGPAECMWAKASPFIAPLITQGAIRLSWVRPAMNVWVPQAPKGAVISRRLPHKLRPRRRVRLVLIEVSSIKTSRSGCDCILGMRYRNHSCR